MEEDHSARPRRQDAAAVMFSMFDSRKETGDETFTLCVEVKHLFGIKQEQSLECESELQSSSDDLNLLVSGNSGFELVFVFWGSRG